MEQALKSQKNENEAIETGFRLALRQERSDREDELRELQRQVELLSVEVETLGGDKAKSASQVDTRDVASGLAMKHHWGKA